MWLHLYFHHIDMPSGFPPHTVINIRKRLWLPRQPKVTALDLLTASSICYALGSSHQSEECSPFPSSASWFLVLSLQCPPELTEFSCFLTFSYLQEPTLVSFPPRHWLTPSPSAQHCLTAVCSAFRFSFQNPMLTLKMISCGMSLFTSILPLLQVFCYHKVNRKMYLLLLHFLTASYKIILSAQSVFLVVVLNLGFGLQSSEQILMFSFYTKRFW